MVGVEIGMVDWLIWTAIDYGEVFDRVIWLDWLSDGVTAQEIRVLKHLYYLAASDVGLGPVGGWGAVPGNGGVRRCPRG